MVTDSSTHPLAPPTQEESLVQWLRLIRSRRVGATTFYRLMAEHGSADAALDALPEIARTAGVKDYAPFARDDALRELDRGRAAGATLIAHGMPAYPALLHDLSDAPPLLWISGRADLLQRPTVALVGARNASSLGIRMARKLAADLGAADQVTVSGLARGIDTAVHQATLDSGTIAVVAGGIDVIYPRENADLARDIAQNGLLVSEMPPGLQPQARHFPRRNRIISGLARAVVVVEAAARSGSLITARDALDQGREVLAVPGHPYDARASGCNMLIRDGAGLVRGAKDVIEALQDNAPAPPPQADIPPPPPERTAPRLTDIAQLHGQILNRLGPTPLAEDQLIRDLNLPAQAVAAELVTLELDGQIIRQPGGLLSRTV
ncbi:DNA-processing protein DprA [Actibacterium ureilyticum]|uniref:DNA-processing protein DprA n=1 Tax=Actibacterium ureilyticum TaxID=1590614 RepID=UPI000BAB19F4|nr:DNA-processing protein DprA [Actibacterium ureilyticum]